MTYSNKLKDPRWQKKRLVVFLRDDWKCARCSRGDEELHVHHKVYRDVDPWEYKLDELETLCHSCHKSTHNIRRNESPPVTASPERDIEAIMSRVASDIFVMDAERVRAEKDGCASIAEMLTKDSQSLKAHLSGLRAWVTLVEKVKDRKLLLGTCLEEMKSVVLVKGAASLNIQTDPERKFHEVMLKMPENQQILNEEFERAGFPRWGSNLTLLR